MRQEVIEGFRLSPQQRQLWQSRGAPGSQVIQCAVVAEGVTGVEWERTLRALVGRHEALRTRFACLPGMEMPIQVLDEEVATAVRRIAAVPADPAALDESIRRWLEEEREPFDLAAAPPVRFAIAPLGEGRDLLILTAHPLCADPRSLESLLRDLARAGGEELDEEVLGYIQFSEWQNELLEDPEEGSEGAAELWARHAQEDRSPVALPIERPVPHGRGAAPRTVCLRLEVEPLERAAASCTARLDTLLLAGWGLLLAHFAEAPEIPVHLYFPGRKFPELRDAVGAFGRYIPLRLRGAAARTLRAEVERLEERRREMEQWEELFPGLADAAPQADAAGFAFDAEELPTVIAEGERHLTVTTAVWTVQPFRLRLSAVRSGASLVLSLQYDPAHFDEPAVRRLADSLEALLQSAAQEPETPTANLEMMGAAERGLLETWNATAAELTGEAVLARLFATQVERAPEDVAVVGPDGQLTFRALGERAYHLAHYLIGLGVGPESRVALCLDRSTDLLTGLFGVLAAGGAYVPFDPWQPAERLAALLADSGAQVVVCHGRTYGRVPRGLWRVVCLDLEAADLANTPARAPHVATGLESLAYAIYTSGSTGLPKAALIENRSVANLLLALRRDIYARLENGRPLRITMNAPVSFDASVKQWVQLLHGHTVLIVPEEVRVDGDAFLSWLNQSHVDVLDCTPSQLRLLLAAGLGSDPDRFSSYPRAVLVGGEAIDPGLWAQLARDKERLFFNVYGPTECTVDTTACPIGAGETPSIGRPLANVRTHLLDAAWRRVPLGAPGELCIAGAGLARGYAGRPDLTAEKFVPDPFAAEPGARLYRTGDRARFCGNGWLEYLGRVDHQVKIRGYRVELGEIEGVLSRHPGVAQAVAALREDQPGRPRLVAYVMPRRRHLEKVGEGRHELPNGLRVTHQNRNETKYLYEEIFESRCYARHGIFLPEDACVFDVGANIGMFTLFVQGECARPRVYAFEPLPPIHDCLRENCRQYGLDVKLFPFGLSDRERTERFTYYPNYSMMSGQSAYAQPSAEIEVIRRFLENQTASGIAGADALLAEAGDLLADRFRVEEAEVPLRRLSEVIREQGVEHIDLLKIDVQRAEMDVLLGLDDDDWPRIDQVVLEVHDGAGEATAGRVDQIRALLEPRGFRVVAEQDELLAGTDRYNVYAVRQGLETRAARAGAREASVLARLREADAAELSADGLREHARHWLPDFMIPSDLVVLEELPVTPNGKVDRRALPAPEDVAAAGQRPVRAPRTPVEEILVGLFVQVLGVEPVGADESFFELGGHSLLATQLMSRVRETFRLELPLRLLFENPTPERLGDAVAMALRTGGLATEAIQPAPRDGDLPLSFAQQRLWFLQQLEPTSAAYSNVKAIRARGAVAPEVLSALLTELVRRHQVLRTTFPAVEGQPAQRIHPPVRIDLPLIDLQGLPEGARLEEACHQVRLESATAFDLAREVVRFRLLRLEATDHLVVFSFHHIVGDAWSLAVIDREVRALWAALLEGRPSPLPELPVQYADYARWQRQWLDGEVLDAHLAYWKKQLAGAPPVLDLASSGPRPRQAVRRTGRSTVTLPESLSRGLRELGLAQGSTAFMTLLAAFSVLVSRCAVQDDVVIGTAIAGRDRLETEGLIGIFINTLPLRVDLSDRPTFLELLARVRQVALGAYAHQNLPFERLVEEVRSEREAGRSPIVQVFFGLQNAPAAALQIPGLELDAFEIGHDEARVELSVWMAESEEGLTATWTYDASLFLSQTIERLQKSFEQLAAGIVAQPEARVHDLEIATEAERDELQSRAQALKQSNLEKFRRAKPRPAAV
ncbi:MAG TPA: amino acid adenylation domain-containing protein [Thermoanaerobaculia bacterium]|nr:amino acid adenylation domain-containing protein [Thermoanaerobaculia bacterium]